MNQVSKQWQNEVEKLGKEAKSLYDSYQASVKTLSDAQKTKKEEEIVFLYPLFHTLYFILIMSDIIHLLPDSVANQIAAGEVIQRPASVIKELVENAIDAEATEIHVLVTDAGKTCIQVIDDGKGMSETDARLSFERHATSKIREASDLFALRTMGFRGEALASVAAVAEVELKTRPAGEELGTRLVIAGSKVESQEAVSCPKGSNKLC